MSSFAQLRRNCIDGRKVHVDNRYRPEVSGEHTIIHALVDLNGWFSTAATT